jgi:hypothetical protein
MLEQKENVDLAQRVLERYTTQKFTTAAEWRAWFSANKNNLFYTEAGGFKFMVNTYNKETAAIKPINSTGKENFGSVPTLADPVVLTASLLDGSKPGTKEVVINVSILKGWHIYAYVPEGSPFIQTQALLELPGEVKKEVEWQSSAGIPFPGDGGMFVWENKADFKTAIDTSALKAGTVIKCGLYYQVCDNNKCFPPKRKMIELQVL